MFHETPAPFSPPPASTPVAETTLNPTVNAVATFPTFSEPSSSTTDTAPAEDFVVAPTPPESHLSSSTPPPLATNAPTNIVTIVAITPAPGASRQPATGSPAGGSDEMSTVPPTAVASGESPAPISVVADISCAAGSVCSGDLCCHPDSNICGRSEQRLARAIEIYRRVP